MRRQDDSFPASVSWLTEARTPYRRSETSWRVKQFPQPVLSCLQEAMDMGLADAEPLADLALGHVLAEAHRFRGRGRRVIFRLGTIARGRTVSVRVNAKVAARTAKGKRTNTVVVRGQTCWGREVHQQADRQVAIAPGGGALLVTADPRPPPR